MSPDASRATNTHQILRGTRGDEERGRSSKAEATGLLKDKLAAPRLEAGRRAPGWRTTREDSGRPAGEHAEVRD